MLNSFFFFFDHFLRCFFSYFTIRINKISWCGEIRLGMESANKRFNSNPVCSCGNSEELRKLLNYSNLFAMHVGMLWACTDPYI